MPVLEIYRHYRMDNGLSAHGVRFTLHLNTCKYGLFEKGGRYCSVACPRGILTQQKYFFPKQNYFFHKCIKLQEVKKNKKKNKNNNNNNVFPARLELRPTMPRTCKVKKNNNNNNNNKESLKKDWWSAPERKSHRSTVWRRGREPWGHSISGRWQDAHGQKKQRCALHQKTTGADLDLWMKI